MRPDLKRKHSCAEITAFPLAVPGIALRVGTRVTGKPSEPHPEEALDNKNGLHQAGAYR